MDCLIIGRASSPCPGHAWMMLCLDRDLADLLEQTMPPDPELVDLIEWAFLDGQIDAVRADLAYYWLDARKKDLHRPA